MQVGLSDGRVIGVSLGWFPRLGHTTPAEREAFEISPFGIHWERLDEDVPVEGLLAGARGSRAGRGRGGVGGGGSMTHPTCCVKIGGEMTINSKVPSWRGLRAMGRSKVVGLSVFVPVFGYYILFSEEIGRYLNLDPEIFNDDQIHGLLLLKLLIDLPRPHVRYFGLVGVAAGSLVFYAFCPHLIKEHESAIAYFRSYDHAASSYEIGFVVRHILSHRRHKEGFYTDWIYRIERSYGSIITNGTDEDKIYEMIRLSRSNDDIMVLNQLKLALVAVTSLRYALEDRSKLAARVLCTVFFFVGFLLVGLASLQAFAQVLVSMSL